MRLQQWYRQRGPAYFRERLAALVHRYGVTPAKAFDRVLESVTLLAAQGCAPTFPTPGRVVQTYPRHFRQLQEMGAEIAVHAFDHVDLSAYPPQVACRQLERAACAFDRHGLRRHGFRGPYLGCNDELLAALPQGLFTYSSNQPIAWDVALPMVDEGPQPAIREVLQRVYKPLQAQDMVSVPWSRYQVVEIPVTLPDDLTLHDAFQLEDEGMAEAWSQILQWTYARGEAFILMFHPELGGCCCDAFATLFCEAARLKPAVWIARLCDIGLWWREKAAFSVDLSTNGTELDLSFRCSNRATILFKDLPVQGEKAPWYGGYRQLPAGNLRPRTVHVPLEPRPFLGLPAGAPAETVTFLREQGYILDLGPTAPRCAIYLDPALLQRLQSKVDLVNCIESMPGPLVRYWRWPDGARSCLSITGDLDALTLLDYAARFFVR